MCVDRQTGGMIALPYAGGFLDQPSKTMQALAVIQGVYTERINEENKRG